MESIHTGVRWLRTIVDPSFLQILGRVLEQEISRKVIKHERRTSLAEDAGGLGSAKLTKRISGARVPATQQTRLYFMCQQVVPAPPRVLRLASQVIPAP